METIIENIETIAKNYSSKGLVSIPIVRGEKKPLVENWSILSPEELLQSFRRFQNCNIGIRLDGLTVLDIERPELWGLFFAPHPEEIAKKTLVSKTGGGGYHVYFRGETKPERANGFAELRSGSKQYVVVPPSLHPSGKVYEWISDLESVDILQPKPELFEEAREKIKTLNQFGSFINKMVEAWKPEHRHQLALWLSGYLRKIGIPKEKAETIIACIVLLAKDEEINDRLRALQDSYKEKENNLKGYSGLIEELESIVGSERTKEFVEVLPKPSIKHEEMAPRKIRVKYVFGGEIFEDHFLEVVVHDNKLKILIYDLDSKTLSVLEEILLGNNKKLKPYPNLPFAMYLPGIPKLHEDDRTLWSETLKFIEDYLDFPDNEVYHILVATIVWSYFVNTVRASTPYLAFVGPFRSGKTRALEVLGCLSYKPIFVVDPTEAVVFRIMEAMRPTLFIDESQVINPNIRAILASGYRYGMKVSRVADPEAKGVSGIQWYDVFGLKIFASRETLPDDLTSRSIIIQCERNIRPIKKKIDLEKAKELRTRWLAKRLQNYNKVSVTYEEFASEDARIQEIMSPLMVMAKMFGGEEAQGAIERYGRRVEERLKEIEETSIEAEIVSKIVSYVNEHYEDAPETISNQDLLKLLNSGLEKPIYTPEKVGKRLASLGFKKKRLIDGKIGYILDYELLMRLARRYYINFSLLPPT